MIEIDVKRGFIVGLVSILLCVGLVILGYLVSPNNDEGSPLLLSPRLAQMKRYQRQVQGWYIELSEIHHDIVTLAEDDKGDLFVGSSLVNTIYGRLSTLENQMDQAVVPPTLINVHELILYTTQLHRETAMYLTLWMSEPTEPNLRALIASLDEASDALKRVYDNPWVRTEVEDRP